MIRRCLVPALVLLFATSAPARQEDGDGRLRLIEPIPRDDLMAVTGLAIDSEGKFVYAASFQSASITTLCPRPYKL